MIKGKKRVALLARVSTKSKEQLTSIDYQIDKLSKIIMDNEEYIFNPDTDIFADRETGTTLNRSHGIHGFNDLMDLLGIEIIDVNTSDEFHVSIKSKKGITNAYDVLFCKSTSRFARCFQKSNLLVLALKEANVEVVFYDINKSSFHDETLIPILSVMDTNFSKNLSYSSRMNLIYKTENREITMKGERIGYDIVWKDKHKYFVANEDAELLKMALKMMLVWNFGCRTVTETFKRRNMKMKNGNFISESGLNRCLRSRLYLGEQKYYDFSNDEEEYLRQFSDKKEYLKKLNFQWLPCKYVEPIFTEEEFNQIQARFNKFSNVERGFRSPYLMLSNKLICGKCHSNFSSSGIYKNDRKYRCSTQIHDMNNCDNYRVQESFIDAEISKKMKSFNKNRNNFLTTQSHNLLYLRLHLVSILGNDTFDEMIKIDDDIQNLRNDIISLASLMLTSDSAKQIISEQIEAKDKEIKDLEFKMIHLKDYEQTVVNFIEEVNDVLAVIDAEIGKTFNYDINVNKNEFLVEEIESIKVFPKGEFVRRSRNATNSVILLFEFKYKNHINRILEKIYKSDVISILVNKGVFGFNKADNSYIVKTIPDNEIEPLMDKLRALEMLE